MGKRSKSKAVRRQQADTVRRRATAPPTRTPDEAALLWLTGGRVPADHVFLAGDSFCFWSPEDEELLIVDVFDGDPAARAATRELLRLTGAAFPTVEAVEAEVRRRGWADGQTLTGGVMTDQEWQALLTDVSGMVEAVRRCRLPDRRLRLFAVACVRALTPLVREAFRADMERLVGVAERFADGRATPDEVADARGRTIPWDFELTAAVEACHPDAGLAAVRTSRAAADASVGLWVASRPAARRRSPDTRAVRRSAGERQAALARCVFGHPFLQLTFDPRWRTETAVALAAGIDHDRAFDRLPVLADALEEAGCDLAEVFEHCRQDSTHDRGCWVVDAALGRSLCGESPAHPPAAGAPAHGRLYELLDAVWVHDHPIGPLDDVYERHDALFAWQASLTAAEGLALVAWAVRPTLPPRWERSRETFLPGVVTLAAWAGCWAVGGSGTPQQAEELERLAGDGPLEVRQAAEQALAERVRGTRARE